MPPPFLDTNILVNHLTQTHPTEGPQSSAVLRKVESEELTVRVSDIVVFETVFTLQRGYRFPREQIAAAVLDILELPGLVLPGKEQYRRVFDLYLTTNIGFADCYHTMLMERLGINEVISFDRDFDKLPGITRRES